MTYRQIEVLEKIYTLLRHIKNSLYTHVESSVLNELKEIIKEQKDKISIDKINLI